MKQYNRDELEELYPTINWKRLRFALSICTIVLITIKIYLI